MMKWQPLTCFAVRGFEKQEDGQRAIPTGIPKGKGHSRAWKSVATSRDAIAAVIANNAGK